jgi:hypothetical protein
MENSAYSTVNSECDAKGAKLLLHRFWAERIEQWETSERDHFTSVAALEVREYLKPDKKGAFV